MCDHPAASAGGSRKFPVSGLTCSQCRSIQYRWPAEPAPNINTLCRTSISDELLQWAPSGSRATPRVFPVCRMSRATWEQVSPQLYDTASTATLLARLGVNAACQVRRRTLFGAFGQRQVSTIYAPDQPISLSFWKLEPEFQLRRRRLSRCFTCTRRAASQLVPLSAVAKRHRQFWPRYRLTIRASCLQ